MSKNYYFYPSRMSLQKTKAFLNHACQRKDHGAQSLRLLSVKGLWEEASGSFIHNTNQTHTTRATSIQKYYTKVQ